MRILLGYIFDTKDIVLYVFWAVLQNKTWEKLNSSIVKVWFFFFIILSIQNIPAAYSVLKLIHNIFSKFWLKPALFVCLLCETLCFVCDW